MSYKETTIKEIAETFKFNKNNALGTVVLTGAGVSISAGIPSANGIIKVIEENFPTISSRCTSKTYPDYMGLLTQMERRRIINDLIENAKLNPAHLYLSSLVKKGYIDRILTVNFDPLAQKALALENIFPGIYDFAASQTFVPGEAADISIFHLHGQKDGFVLLNTEKEVESHFEKLKTVFNDSLIKRTLIVVGYSGLNDPVFKHLKEIKSFEGRLYWIGFEDHEPSKEIEKGILEGDKYSFFLKGYNADTFFIELSKELGIEGPRIVSRPFEYLSEVLENFSLLEMKDKDPTDIVKETKKWVHTAKAIFQDRDKEAAKNIFENFVNFENEELIKLARETWLNDINENYDDLLESITDSSPDEAKKYFSYFLINRGVECGRIADLKTGSEAEKLYREAITKFEKAIEIKPDEKAYYNWGLSLMALAKPNSGSKAEILYQEAISKFEKVIEIKADLDGAYGNWGVSLVAIADLKTGSEAEKLYREAITKFEKAIEIKPDEKAYYNWGFCLKAVAKLSPQAEAESLYGEAVAKFEKAISIRQDFDSYYNLGLCLKAIAELNTSSTAEELYWEAVEKFKKVIELKPDLDGAYGNWGTILVAIAEFKTGNEKEKLLKEAIELLTPLASKKPGYFSYDLACLYSMINDKFKAIEFLCKCKNLGFIINKEGIEDDKDFKNIANEPEFIAFLSELEDTESEDQNQENQPKGANNT